jgi:hypothetical protein
VQKELMDETVFILSAEVPQGHVACLSRRGDGVGIELLWSQGPQLHAEGGALFFVALFCQSQRQTRFPDVAFTNEDNFGAGRVDNLGCCGLNIIQRGTCVYRPRLYDDIFIAKRGYGWLSYNKVDCDEIVLRSA